MKKQLSLIGLVSFILVGAQSIQATTWDLTSSFSTADNPNGAWSYGWEQTLGGTLNLYNTTSYNWYGTQWGDSNHHSGDRTPNIWENTSSSTLYGVSPGEVSLHPGWDGSFSVAQWTSPTAAQVSVSGYFGAGDAGPIGGSMSYYVLENGSVVDEWYNDPGTEMFSFTTTVAADSTIDFIVGTGNSGYYYGTTPLSATITSQSVPDGGLTVALLGGALFGLQALRRKLAT